MPKTSAERSAAYKARNIEKVNAGNKKKCKNYRERLKESLTNEEKAEQRRKNLERLHRFRATKKLGETVLKTSLTPQIKGKLMKRTRNALNGSRDQNVIILKSLLREYDGQEPIPSRNSLSKRLPAVTVEAIQKFYFCEDISRPSPNVNDFITVKENGEKRKISVRHSIYSIKEVHGMFVRENPDHNVSFSKFFNLKPANVLSFSKMPHNVCCCQIHENLRCALKAIQKCSIFNEILTDNEMHKNFVCEPPTIDCFSNVCEYCMDSWIFRQQEADIENLLQEISWFKWVKTDQKNNSEANIYCNIEKVKKTGNIQELLQEIYDQVPVFLDHQYVKMNQSRTSRRMIQEASDPNADGAVIIVDFAEKFKCVQQNATQSAHYGQTPVSLFTVAVYHRVFRPMVIASDFEKHTKEAVLAYLDEIIKRLPPSVKKIDIWSDNATSQFKNQFVMEGMKSFEIRHNKLIRWHFYAPMHGKSVVDGIGGNVKRFVRDKIIAQNLLVKSAEDFVEVASKMDTEVILMKTSDIEARNISINLPNIIKTSKKINDIKKFHSFSVHDVKVGKKLLKKIVGLKISQQL